MDTQTNFLMAAEKIKKASFLIIGAGAGMSADSGLATYADVSTTFEYFEKNNLTYRDLSNPDLFIKNPNVAFGWCAVCVQKYRTTVPHEGYQILKSWKQKYFTQSPYTEILKKEMRENYLRILPNNAGPSLPGTFFIYTTNVDNFFHRAGFLPEEICCTHGSYLFWQCSGIPKVKHPFKLFDKPCTNQVWPIPDDFEFEVDIANMSAPPGPPRRASVNQGWTTNHPTCPNCGQLQRPNVYNFGDQCFIANEIEEAHCANWCHVVEKIVKRDPGMSVVMVELGVGKRLPKIRVTFDRMLESLNGFDATIIRINPEITKGDLGPSVIGLKCGALEALQKINIFL